MTSVQNHCTITRNSHHGHLLLGTTIIRVSLIFIFIYRVSILRASLLRYRKNANRKKNGESWTHEVMPSLFAIEKANFGYAVPILSTCGYVFGKNAY